MGTKTVATPVMTLAPFLPVKKESPNMGTKTLRRWKIYHIRNLACEKRIPKHGDENLSMFPVKLVLFSMVKKESPNMGTKTTANFSGVHKSYYDEVKKESPNMGTKTPFKVFLFLFLSFSREKGIPKHGDENFSCK